MQKTLSYLVSIAKIDRSALMNVGAYGMVGFVYIGLQGVLTNLYLIELGLDLSFVGAMTAVGMVIWALFSVPAGMVGARIGSRVSSVIGFIVISTGMALFLCIALLPRPLWEIGFYLTYGLTFLGASMAAVNGAPHLMGVTPENERNAAFTLSGALLAITGFIGSLVAGFLPGVLMRVTNGSLDQAEVYNTVLWLGVPAYLLSAVLMFKARSAPPIIEETHGSIEIAQPPWGLLIFIGVLFIVQMMSENFFFLFFNVYLNENLAMPTGSIGTIFAVGRLFPFFLSPLLPLALNRWGSGRVMTAVYVVFAFLVLVLAWIPTWQTAAAGFILAGLLTNFSGTSRSLYSQENVKPRWRTTVSAVMIISMAGAIGIAGLVGGKIIPVIGFRGMFTIGAALALLAVVLFTAWQYRSSRRPRVTEPAAPL